MLLKNQTSWSEDFAKGDESEFKKIQVGVKGQIDSCNMNVPMAKRNERRAERWSYLFLSIGILVGCGMIVAGFAGAIPSLGGTVALIFGGMAVIALLGVSSFLPLCLTPSADQEKPLIADKMQDRLFNSDFYKPIKPKKSVEEEPPHHPSPKPGKKTE